MSDTHYLFENLEVKTTGRLAKKEKSGRNNTIQNKVLHEITPVDQTMGTWTKWVELDALFVIEDNNNK